MACKVDVILIDTAGRLHTRFNLMEELRKIHRGIGKALEEAPHHVWLVLDATSGQNALAQARAFKEAVHVDGVILSSGSLGAWRHGLRCAARPGVADPVCWPWRKFGRSTIFRST